MKVVVKDRNTSTLNPIHSSSLPFPADAVQFRIFFIASITIFFENLELSEN